MAATCDVQLDNISGVYQPGQMVNGNIVLNLQQRALFKSFVWKFSGYAASSWEKLVTPKKTKSKKIKDGITAEEIPKPKEFYENRDDYIAITNYMIGSESAMPYIVDAGRYTYNFSVHLPATCPSSIESVHGHIRYELLVFIVYPEHNEIMYTRSFNVIKPFDLRGNYQLLEPANVDCTEQIVRTKFWQRAMQLHVNVPQTGYVPGEKISVYIKLLNDGHAVLEQLVYKLNMVGTYTGYSKRQKLRTKEERTNLLTTTHALQWQKVNVLEHLASLQFPAEAKPTLDGTQCRCMQLTYEVEVCIRTTADKRRVCARVPIVVGTISLHDRQKPWVESGTQFLASAPPAEFVVATDTATPRSTLCAGHLTGSMNSLSSSFKEADYMTAANLNKEFKQTMAGELQNFKPKYLYYNINASIQEDKVSSTN